MGREARCACRWGDREGAVVATLESTELAVRGDVRARARLHDLEGVAVRDEHLEFVVAGERVRLALGFAVARRWADAIAAPAPTLARKLGIETTTRVHMIGIVDDDGLRAAISGATIVSSLDAADIAFVLANDGDTLERFAASAARAAHAPPTWIVYEEGRAAPLGEVAVRDTLRRSGFVDTKVASISDRLTGLRFVRQT